jgi:hypothetical protein
MDGFVQHLELRTCVENDSVVFPPPMSRVKKVTHHQSLLNLEDEDSGAAQVQCAGRHLECANSLVKASGEGHATKVDLSLDHCTGAAGRIQVGGLEVSHGDRRIVRRSKAASQRNRACSWESRGPCNCCSGADTQHATNRGWSLL